MKSLAPNTLLQNRYLIVHLIGKGGMGEVYLAVDQRLGSAVALKRTLHGDDTALGDAFEREARTLARLRHPALPKVSDHFIENDNQFLVMEHIAGDDLAKRLKATQKPFPISWVLYWADQLLDGLAYLHSHEPPIIHRDIKPQNLKLTDENNIVLLDFGLSKNSTGQTTISGSGSSGSIVGYTPHYAPMEQIRGTGTNPRSDIYSLSATLYQLLTNIVPPDALTRADFLLSGKADPIAPINEINHDIPKSISDVIIKGMSISQDQRFSDARAMQKILRETYAAMQKDDAEKTIAFNVQEEPLVSSSQVVEVTNENNGQSSAPVYEAEIVSKEAMGAKTVPFSMIDNASFETPSVNPPTQAQTDQFKDFNATWVMDEKPESASLPDASEPIYEATEVSAPTPQSSVKTEVMGDFGAAEYLEDNQSNAPQNLTADDFNFKTEENFAAKEVPAPNVTGDKTVPLISFDDFDANQSKDESLQFDPAQTMPAGAFDPAPKIMDFSDLAEQPAANDNFAPAGQPDLRQSAPAYNSKPQKATVGKQPEKKKSKGLLIGILAGLFGLIALAAVGGGAAWYFMNQQGISNITNTATPTPLPVETPTPEPTVEQLNTNTNSDNSNSQIVTTTSPENVNTTPSPEDTKTVEPTQTPVTQPTRATQTPKPVITTNTPRPSTPKPTVKPVTKPTLRGTTIPQ